jgi:hypothetical protein
MIGMNEGVELPKLEFQRRTGIVLPGNFRHGPDDVGSVLNAALVVVGHVEHEEILEIELTQHENSGSLAFGIATLYRAGPRTVNAGILGGPRVFGFALASSAC